MKIWLIVWGLLSLIAVSAPAIVAVSMFLIAPGLILIAAPTVFLYSALFAFYQRVMRIPLGWKRNTLAAVLSLFSGWAVAQPWAVISHHEFVHADLPEVLPASPIQLRGNIRLETPTPTSARKPGPESCRELCAALLDTPGVTSVALAATGAPATEQPLVYRLVPRAGDRSRSLFPLGPEQIMDNFPLWQANGLPRDYEALMANRKKEKQAIAAGWGVRLASAVKLTAEKIAMQPDFTIRLTEDQRSKREVSVSRVEVLDRNAKALLRRSVVVGSALSAPLRFDGQGSIENFHIALSRDRLSNAPANSKLEPQAELFRNTSLAQPHPDLRTMNALLERVRNASSNPSTSPDDPDFGLPGLWLPTVDWQRPLPSEQLSVLKLLISDPRIPVPQQLYSGYETKVAPELRGALATRIVSPTTPAQTRKQLARLLSRMPQGTFDKPSSDEQRIMSAPELRADAYPMIVRLADQGAKGVPRLIEILNSDSSDQDVSSRRSVLHAVALAFALLGPEAHSALPQVDALISSNREARDDSSSTRAWNVALVRMGKPIEEFDWHSSKPEFVAKQRDYLRKQVERFDPKNVWSL